MNAPIPPDQFQCETRGQDSLGARWSAIQGAGEAVAMLAGFAAEKQGAAERDFAAAIAGAGGWRLELARDGMADMAAML